MFSQEVMEMLIKGIGETLYMTLGATIFGYVLGLPMGIIMVTTSKDGIRPNAGVYKVLDVIVNIGRSIPFLILLILLMPLTKAIVGKSYGSTATIVPLVISAAPSPVSSSSYTSAADSVKISLPTKPISAAPCST